MNISKLAVTTIVALVVTGSYFVIPKILGYSDIKVCNASPYQTEHVIIAQKGDEFQTIRGWFRLQPGECEKEYKFFGGDTKNFYVHSSVPSKDHKVVEYVNQIVNSNILNDDDTSNDQYALKITGVDFQHFGDIAICSNSRENLNKPTHSLRRSCGPDTKYPAHFLGAWNYDSDENWYFIFESPNLSLVPDSPNIDTAFEVLGEALPNLRVAIDAQIFNARSWRSNVPFSVGGNLLDFNGPLNMGVGVSDVAEKTIYGQQMGLRSGDVIVEMNGRKIFGNRDLNQILINHGLSRSHGIEKPVEYVVLRNSKYVSFENTYFFNQNYRQYATDQRGLAFWYGVGDGITFGNTPWALCYGNNALRAAGNFLGVVAEGLSSWSQDREYDESRRVKIDYIDAAECTWQQTQAKGLAQQKEQDIYVNSQWIAIFTPSGVRVAGAKAFRRYAARTISKGAIGRGVADGTLEAIETALWSVGTSAPGTSLQTRFGEAAKFAPLGAAAGFVTGAALSRR